MQNYIFDKLMAAGADFGIKPFGIRAMDSLRLEKSYKLVGRELSIEYAGVRIRPRALREPQEGFSRQATRCSAGATRASPTSSSRSELFGVDDADARGSEPVSKDGRAIGRTTSGGYGWRTAKSLALAMVKPEFAALGTEMEVSVLGEAKRAVVIGESPYDADNAALRS